jgi:hypothetical protein
VTISTLRIHILSTLVTIAACRTVARSSDAPSPPLLLNRSYRVAPAELRMATKRALLLRGFTVTSDSTGSTIRADVEASGRFADGQLVADRIYCDRRPPLRTGMISLTAVVDSTDRGATLDIKRGVASTQEPGGACEFDTGFIDALLAQIGAFARGERM